MFGGACMKCSGEKYKGKKMMSKPEPKSKGKNNNMMMKANRGK
jgi:hypothetical protein